MSAFVWNWIKADAVMRRGLLRGASSGARDVADYAEEQLMKAGRDGQTVTLNKEEMAKELGVSLRSIQRAVQDLIARNALSPINDERGCDTFIITYARAGMNQAERDEEKAKQQAADKRKSAQMQQATVLEFKRKQATEGEASARIAKSIAIDEQIRREIANQSKREVIIV